MAVNEMIPDLERVLADGPQLLKPGGRLAVLTYHSGESLRVRRAFKSLARLGGHQLLTPRPLTPSAAECRTNAGARSAQLRVLARLAS
jgi:16S rRNA (cytosine1402-N4)-methyltransferase